MEGGDSWWRYIVGGDGWWRQKVEIYRRWRWSVEIKGVDGQWEHQE